MQQVLVSGGSGFVASHILLQLLEQGYRVNTTVRNQARAQQLWQDLRDAGITSDAPLTIFEADLLSDTNWAEACSGCEFVLHVASPIFLRLPKSEDEMIKPALDGTRRVLKAARNAGVKRVVMTSNFGAVGYSHKDTIRPIDETCWTDPNQPGLSVYNKSKVLAERAAWDFIANEGAQLELTVINTMAIMGPTLSKKLSSGLELLKKIINGDMKRLPNVTLGIVDVRDVAALHLLAMTSPEAKGERFLALAGGTMSFVEVARYLKHVIPQYTHQTATSAIPDWVFKLIALFNPQARAITPLLGVNRNASNEKARRLLGWQPRSNEDALLAAAKSLIDFNLLDKQ